MTWHGRGRPPPGVTERRRVGRSQTKTMGVLHVKGARVPVVIENISKDGTKLRLNATVGDQTLEAADALEITGLFKVPVKLRWRDDDGLGAEFDLPGPRRAMMQGQIKKMLSRTTRR